MTYLLYYCSLFISYCNCFCVEPITRPVVTLSDVLHVAITMSLKFKEDHSPFIINTLMEDDLNVDIESREILL
jgi:hypothetical protein